MALVQAAAAPMYCDMRPAGPPGSAINDSTTSPASRPLPSLPPSRGRELVLCLSGGGFRATYFHLGVVRYLCDIGELPRVSDIFAVSGGSLLAAHLAQRWDEYKNPQTFNAAADDLRAFADRDVRGRIVRGWLLAGTWFGLPLFCRSLRRQQLLVREYERFFSQGGRSTQLSVLSPNGRLSPKGGRLPDGPRVHLLTTSLTTGLLCEFSGDGFVRFDDRRPVTPVQSPRFSLPLAVAASSAFPPLFPPISIDADVFGIARKDFGVDVDNLSDGGVYDNLRISAAMSGFWYSGVSSRGSDILVSDASGCFDWNTRSPFWNVIGRTARSSDVLMKRVAELQLELQRIGVAALRAEWERLRDEWKTELQRLSDYPPCTLRVVRIDGSQDNTLVLDRLNYNAFEARWDPIVRYAAPMPDPSPWAKGMASMRTDLDRFSREERGFLEIWGYERASGTWKASGGGGGLPGWRPEPIGPPPTDAQLTQLQKSDQRKHRLIVLRDPVGIALSISSGLLAILGGIFGWHLTLKDLPKLLEWLNG